MLSSISLFLFGLALLWGSSELVLRKITPIARFFKVNDLVVTILGVSVLSSLPELTVSGFAIARGNSALSIGNVIGSNFVTLTFVTALCAFIRPINVHDQIRERESSWMILAAAMTMILSIDGKLTRFDGLLLILTYIPYIISVIRSSKKDTLEHQAHELSGNMVLHFVLAIVAIFGIIISARLALDNGEKIGLALGISPLALGVILFAFGTSLPELAISLSATFKNKAEVTIGEVYASNIFTQCVVLGTCALIRPIDISQSVIGFAMPFLILAGVTIQIFITSGRRLSRTEAAILMLMYVVFAATNFFKVPGLDTLIG